MTTPSTTVRPALPAERPLIEGLAQFYIYDFSELEPPGSTGFVFDARGTFGSLPHMQDYWTGAPDHHVLLIEVDGTAAGFALLNSRSHRDGGWVEYNVGEFFVARKFRRQGVARAAFHQVLTLYPGQWEAAVVAHNGPALAFWPQAIACAPHVSEVVRHEGDGVHWTGPIWSFRAARA